MMSLLKVCCQGTGLVYLCYLYILIYATIFYSMFAKWILNQYNNKWPVIVQLYYYRYLTEWTAQVTSCLLSSNDADNSACTLTLRCLVKNSFQRRACSSSLSPSYHLCLPLGVTDICLSNTPVRPHTDYLLIHYWAKNTIHQSVLHTVLCWRAVCCIINRHEMLLSTLLMFISACIMGLCLVRYKWLTFKFVGVHVFV